MKYEKATAEVIYFSNEDVISFDSQSKMWKLKLFENIEYYLKTTTYSHCDAINSGF